MSQKKVDAYKKEKANREKIIKKEKRILLIEKIVGLVVCLAAVCWIGYSVYAKVTANQEVVVKDTVMDTSALDDYVSGLTADEEAVDVTDAEEADAEETEAAADEEETGSEETEVVADAEETVAEETETVAGTDETDAASAEDTADTE